MNTCFYFCTAVDVQLETVTRKCIEVDEDDSDYSNGCHNNLPDNAENLFKSLISLVSLGAIDFSGGVCYSTDDISPTTLSASNSISGSHLSYVAPAMLVVAAITKFGLV